MTLYLFFSEDHIWSSTTSFAIHFFLTLTCTTDSLPRSGRWQVNPFWFTYVIFHVLSHILLIYMCKLHWNLNTMFVWQVNYFWFTYVILHVLSNSLLIYICKLHWNLNTMFVCQVNYFWFTYVILHVLSHLLLIYICKLHWNSNP